MQISVMHGFQMTKYANRPYKRTASRQVLLLVATPVAASLHRVRSVARQVGYAPPVYVHALPPAAAQAAPHAPTPPPAARQSLAAAGLLAEASTASHAAIAVAAQASVTPA